MTKVLILIEGSNPPSFRVDETGISFDQNNDRAREESVVTFIPLDDLDNTYGPQGKTANNVKTGAYLNTYG